MLQRQIVLLVTLSGFVKKDIRRVNHSDKLAKASSIHV